MSNDNRTGLTGGQPPAEPPGGGRTDQESMRRAAHLKVEGPASSDVLAAGGGLDVPGGAELMDERTTLEREREGGLDRHGAKTRGSHG